MHYRRIPPRPATLALGLLLLASVIYALGFGTGLMVHGADNASSSDVGVSRSGQAGDKPAARAGTPGPTPPRLSSIPVAGGAATHAASAVSATGSLPTSFQQLQSRLHARSVGLAYAELGDQHVVQLGDWQSGPAWSTMKVPLSVAAFRRSSSTEVATLVHRAITQSDNSAAEALWGVLAGGKTAATAVDAILADYGDNSTQTQARRVRPSYTPFGQTAWSLKSQVTFVSNLFCSKTDTAVVHEMARVTSGQSWGLGALENATFKGGWGPDTSGRYLVRQFGVVTVGGRQVAVAVAIEPGDGSFAQGIHGLDLIAAWLGQNVHPTAGACPGT